MEWDVIIAALGGGPMAIMVIGLAYFCWHKNKRVEEVQDKIDEVQNKRIEEQKETLRMYFESMASMDKAINQLLQNNNRR